MNRVSKLILPQLREHLAEWKDCEQCDIGSMAHRHVFFRGTLPCDVLFVGEAPGKDEDRSGSPFVGRSGKLLDQWIKLSVPPGVRYAVANSVACRPCDRKGGPNRPPTGTELDSCGPRFHDFVHIANPYFMVLVGRTAQSVLSLLPEYYDAHTCIYHPAYVLRNGTPKAMCDKILQQLRTAIGSAREFYERFWVWGDSQLDMLDLEDLGFRHNRWTRFHKRTKRWEYITSTPLALKKINGKWANEYVWGRDTQPPKGIKHG